MLNNSCCCGSRGRLYGFSSLRCLARCRRCGLCETYRLNFRSAAPTNNSAISWHKILRDVRKVFYEGLIFLHGNYSSEIARDILTHVSVFEGRTALEATNAKGTDLFTMNTLKECSKLLCKGLDGDLSQTAIQFWRAVAQHHPDWRDLETKDASMLRTETLSFHAITLNAIALIGNQQLKETQGFTWLQALKKMNWSAHNPDLEGLCRFGGRITKNRKTAIALAQYFLRQME